MDVISCSLFFDIFDSKLSSGCGLLVRQKKIFGDNKYYEKKMIN